MAIDYRGDLNRVLLEDVERFWSRLDERVLYQMGERPDYQVSEPALAVDVDYFHPNICADARLRYLGEHIALNTSLTPHNKLGNALVSHFYGSKRIHSILTGITDPNRAHVDFERIVARDLDYLAELRANAAYAWSHGYKFYGTTELHTSLQTAGRNYVRKLYNEPDRPASNLDILEWIASWIKTGDMDKILGAQTLGEGCTALASLPGIGDYYCYHGAIGASVLRDTKFLHNGRYCLPGPGARETAGKLFPTLSQSKKFNAGEAILWMEEHQAELFPNLTFHPALHNVVINGEKLYLFEQDRFTPYALEVGMCQFSVLQRFREQPHLIAYRRAPEVDLSAIKLREEGNPVEPTRKPKLSVSSKKISSLLQF